jgi:hypothetical protein
MDIGEGGLEMGEDLGGRLARGVRRQMGRQLGRRAASAQSRADLALRPVEAFPDALHCPIAQLASKSVAGGADAAGNGALEEAPQGGGGQAEPPDFVGEPDAESPPATGTCLAVVAKDTPGAHRLSLGAAFVKSVQTAVPIQRADGLAVRTGRLLEPLGNADPFLLATIKPTLFAHVRLCQRRNYRFYERKKCGVEAGYDMDP